MEASMISKYLYRWDDEELGSIIFFLEDVFTVQTHLDTLQHAVKMLVWGLLYFPGLTPL